MQPALRAKMRALFKLFLFLVLLDFGWASAVGDACTLANRATTCDTAGHFCDTAGSVGAADTCQEVPVGSYSSADSGESISCGTEYTTTATGTGGSDAQTACICDAGYERGDSTTGTACQLCEFGYYKAAASNADCGACASTEQSTDDRTGCINKPTGQPIEQPTGQALEQSYGQSNNSTPAMSRLLYTDTYRQLDTTACEYLAEIKVAESLEAAQAWRDVTADDITGAAAAAATAIGVAANAAILAASDAGE